MIDTGMFKALKLEELDPEIVASLVKSFLSKLPKPLIPQELYASFHEALRIRMDAVLQR